MASCPGRAFKTHGPSLVNTRYEEPLLSFLGHIARQGAGIADGRQPMARPEAGAALALACCLWCLSTGYSSVDNPAQVSTTKHRILVLNLPDAVSHQFVFFKVRGAS